MVRCGDLSTMMDNQEDVFDALRDFEKKPPSEIPPLLDEYLNRVASTGETIFPWCNMKPLFLNKLDKVMHQFQNESPMDLMTSSPNVENVKFEELRIRIIQAVERFHGAPFTIQRLCELITEPKKHYKRTDKFLRGVEKNVLVVSTVDPFGRKIVSESKNLVNGLDLNGHTALKPEATQGGVTLVPSSPKHSIPPPPSTTWTSDQSEAVSSCMETDPEIASTSATQTTKNLNKEESAVTEAESGQSEPSVVKSADDNNEKVETSSGSSSSSSVETSPSDSPDQPCTEDDMEQDVDAKNSTESEDRSIPEPSPIESESSAEPVLTEADVFQTDDEQPLVLPSSQALCTSMETASKQSHEVFAESASDVTPAISADTAAGDGPEIPLKMGMGGDDEVQQVQEKEEPSSSEDKSKDSRHAGGDGGIGGISGIDCSAKIGSSSRISGVTRVGDSGIGDSNTGIISSSEIDSSDQIAVTTKSVRIESSVGKDSVGRIGSSNGVVTSMRVGGEGEVERGGEEGISSSEQTEGRARVSGEERTSASTDQSFPDVVTAVSNSVHTSYQAGSSLETLSSETMTTQDSTPPDQARTPNSQEDQSKEVCEQQSEDYSSTLSNKGDSESVSSSSENVTVAVAMETEESPEGRDKVPSSSVAEDLCSSSVVTEETPPTSTEEPMDQD